MKQRFNWNEQLNEIYAVFPEGKQQPVIGITGNFDNNTCTLSKFYYQSVIRAGGTPFIIPPSDDKNVIISTLDHIDALILSGGADYNPLYDGEEPIHQLHGINAERDLPELLITRLAYNRQIPIMGICRGIQTLATALGGHVTQDIYAQQQASVKHSQDANRDEPTHSVSIEKDSILYDLYKEVKLYVNSFHHQAVKDTGHHFRITARATDGIIEAMESTEHKPIIGVQWHPECMDEGAPLFQWLVKEASIYKETKTIHKKVLTLDTHCDTPMFFPQGIHFEQRDPKILVDLHKMNEGRQDATIMVAYLPQPKENETFDTKIGIKDATPFSYANMIFDKIEDIARQNNKYMRIARTPEELIKNKRDNKVSVMLGIENGLAINGKIENIAHFANRGIVYITLCHNGDNDICDSARGCDTHKGVSDFGKKVIGEMNRLGIMVDLSHAGEKSFYDAIDISQTPIVCSHSSSRALCNHPRNLTDEQMRTLARNGGVCQITAYHGFLRTDGKATIMDLMEHLDHAISIMGIDHVGLGTDFDGDGGIPGLASSSELINFTRQLLLRRYNIQDIQKIWGGNFLRVMNIVQQHKN